MKNPSAWQIKDLRLGVGRELGLGITAAQDWCAASLHTSRRAFQQWEAGDRKIHPAFWELLQMKASLLTASRTGGTDEKT